MHEWTRKQGRQQRGCVGGKRQTHRSTVSGRMDDEASSVWECVSPVAFDSHVEEMSRKQTRQLEGGEHMSEGRHDARLLRFF
eukprot:543600-Rhodomonas_salina.1